MLNKTKLFESTNIIIDKKNMSKTDIRQKHKFQYNKIQHANVVIMSILYKMTNIIIINIRKATNLIIK